MSHARRPGTSALLIAVALLVALTAPAGAFALVGEPIPGAEIFLAQEPGDDPISVPTDASDHAVNEDFSIAWPAGAVAAPTPIVATVGYSAVGEIAGDGTRITRVARLTPDGQTFLLPITISLALPSGYTNGRMYLKDPGTGVWNSVSSSKNGDKLTTDIGHFSIYGVGGDPVPTVSTPASSSWSLVLATGIVMTAGFFISRRRTSGSV